MRLTCALKRLSKRFIKLIFARFLISGLFNTGTTYLLYLGFLQIYSYRIAYTCAFVLGVFISYALNAWFVFRSGVSIKSLIRFPVAYLAQYVLGLVLVAILVEYADISEWIAPLFAIIVTVPLTFGFSKIIVNVQGVCKL